MKPNHKIVMHYPYVPKEAGIEVAKTLKTRWIGQGPKVEEFEQKFNEKFGVTGIAVNSGTAALELAYDILGIGPGDEVITTPLTCTATNLPIIRRGAKLVFADIKRDTLTIDPEDVERKLTPKTKAVVSVDLGGIESTRAEFWLLDPVQQVQFRIPLIVDAAQALGNTGGDFTCYSFQAIKHITTGDGGFFACESPEALKEAKLRRWFGIDRDLKLKNNWQPYKNRAILFDIVYPGYKFQMNDISATLGLVGLEHYDEGLAYRERIFDIYREYKLPLVDGPKNKYWLATLLVEDRDGFAAYLEHHGIETNVVQVRNDIYSVFEPFKTDLPNMDWVEERYISIPLHQKMSLNDARYVGKIAQEFLHG